MSFNSSESSAIIFQVLPLSLFLLHSNYTCVLTRSTISQSECFPEPFLLFSIMLSFCYWVWVLSFGLPSNSLIIFNVYNVVTWEYPFYSWHSFQSLSENYPFLSFKFMIKLIIILCVCVCVCTTVICLLCQFLLSISSPFFLFCQFYKVGYYI